jgi:hypothetical protein
VTPLDRIVDAPPLPRLADVLDNHAREMSEASR